MKNKIYKDDFESFLKESANDFLMVPSRKVWYSIYNNMHPDRKWPSVAVCMLILSAVLYIGVSNNNSLSVAARRSIAEKSRLAATVGTETADVPNTRTASPSRTNLPGQSTTYQSGILSNILLADNSLLPVTNSNGFSMYTGPNDVIVMSSTPLVFSTDAKSGMAISGGESLEGKETTSVSVPTVKNQSASLAISGQDYKTDFPENKKQVGAINKNKKSPDAKTITKEKDDIEKAWKEDFAFRNQPRRNNFRQKASVNYFITPSFGYRGLFNNKRSSGTESSIHDGAALNLELGAVLQYKLTPTTRLKGGLQVNYTNYVSNVTELQHPTQTTLAVTDRTAVRASDYAVKAGASKLNKTTFQVAMPLGADFKIAGKDKIKWFVGAAIQPTYVISGSAYVLSADGKNYISETPLLRKWNLNAALETFVSFKAANGVTINVGPQFRYQLLSTYKEQYNYTEKLYNIGVKLGITTSL